MFQYAFPLRKTEPKIVTTTTTTDYYRQTSDEHGFLRPSYTIAPSGQLDYTFRTAGVVPQQLLRVYCCSIQSYSLHTPGERWRDVQ